MLIAERMRKALLTIYDNTTFTAIDKLNTLFDYQVVSKGNKCRRYVVL